MRRDSDTVAAEARAAQTALIEGLQTARQQTKTKLEQTLPPEGEAKTDLLTQNDIDRIMAEILAPFQALLDNEEMKHAYEALRVKRGRENSETCTGVEYLQDQLDKYRRVIDARLKTQYPNAIPFQTPVSTPPSSADSSEGEHELSTAESPPSAPTPQIPDTDDEGNADDDLSSTEVPSSDEDVLEASDADEIGALEAAVQAEDDALEAEIDALPEYFPELHALIDALEISSEDMKPTADGPMPLVAKLNSIETALATAQRELEATEEEATRLAKATQLNELKQSYVRKLANIKSVLRQRFHEAVAATSQVFQSIASDFQNLRLRYTDPACDLVPPRSASVDAHAMVVIQGHGPTLQRAPNFNRRPQRFTRLRKVFQPITNRVSVPEHSLVQGSLKKRQKNLIAYNAAYTDLVRYTMKLEKNFQVQLREVKRDWAQVARVCDQHIHCDAARSHVLTQEGDDPSIFTADEVQGLVAQALPDREPVLRGIVDETTHYPTQLLAAEFETRKTELVAAEAALTQRRVAVGPGMPKAASVLRDITTRRKRLNDATRGLHTETQGLNAVQRLTKYDYRNARDGSDALSVLPPTDQTRADEVQSNYENHTQTQKDEVDRLAESVSTSFDAERRQYQGVRAIEAQAKQTDRATRKYDRLSALDEGENRENGDQPKHQRNRRKALSQKAVVKASLEQLKKTIEAHQRDLPASFTQSYTQTLETYAGRVGAPQLSEMGAEAHDGAVPVLPAPVVVPPNVPDPVVSPIPRGRGHFSAPAVIGVKPTFKKLLKKPTDTGPDEIPRQGVTQLEATHGHPIHIVHPHNIAEGNTLTIHSKPDEEVAADLTEQQKTDLREGIMQELLTGYTYYSLSSPHTTVLTHMYAFLRALNVPDNKITLYDISGGGNRDVTARIRQEVQHTGLIGAEQALWQKLFQENNPYTQRILAPFLTSYNELLQERGEQQLRDPRDLFGPGNARPASTFGRVSGRLGPRSSLPAPATHLFLDDDEERSDADQEIAGILSASDDDASEDLFADPPESPAPSSVPRGHSI